LNFNLHLRPYPHRQSITIIPLNGTCISPDGAPTHRRWHFNTHTHTQVASASSVYEAGSCVVVFVFVAVRTAVSTIAGA
jgi:hypothetical protein